MTISGQPVLVEDVITAALVSRSNILVLSRPGQAKTTLEHDIFEGMFGGKGVYVRAHPKMDERELFTHLNLEKFFGGQMKSSTELREMLDTIHTNCMIVDEITRLPGILQNRLFGLADGYIEIDGRKHTIGNGYSVVIASGNPEDEGTFALSAALKERFQVILNLRDFQSPSSDSFVRLMHKHDPRVPHVEIVDASKDLISINSEFRQLPASVMMVLAAQYLIYALDDCSKLGVPKSSIEKGIPHNCSGCPKLAKGCGYFSGISERAAHALVNITLALQQVVATKTDTNTKSVQEKIENDVLDLLESFKTFCPETGITNHQHVMQRYFGNPRMFLIEIASAAMAVFNSKMKSIEKLRDAVLSQTADVGLLDVFTKEIDGGPGMLALKNHWRFVADLFPEK